MVKAGKKIDFKFKRDWPVLVPIIPLFLFTIITPYFGLYEYLIPLGLHEWAGENFQDFFRSLDEYSDNPMRDKVMYSWVTLLGSLFGILGFVFFLDNDKKQDLPFFSGDFKGLKKNILVSFFTAFLCFLILSYVWLVYHNPSASKGFRFDGVGYYFLCCMFSFVLGTMLSSFFYANMKLLKIRNVS